MRDLTREIELGRAARSAIAILEDGTTPAVRCCDDAAAILRRSLEPIATDPVLFVNHERTLMVRSWASGTIEVVQRPDTSHTWGPPTLVEQDGTP